MSNNNLKKIKSINEKLQSENLTLKEEVRLTLEYFQLVSKLSLEGLSKYYDKTF